METKKIGEEGSLPSVIVIVQARRRARTGAHRSVKESCHSRQLYIRGYEALYLI